MLPKIKILSIASFIIALSCQTTIFAMDHQNENLADLAASCEVSTNNKERGKPREIEPVKHLKEIPEYIKEVNDLQSTQTIINNILEHLNSIDGKKEIINNDDIAIVQQHFNNLSVLYQNEKDKQKYLQDIDFNFFSQYQSSDFFLKKENKILMNNLVKYVNTVFTKNKISITDIKNNSQPINKPKEIIKTFKATNNPLLDKTKQELYDLIKDCKKNASFQKHAEKIHELWNNFLALHNHNWLDHILYRDQPDIHSPQEAKYLRHLIFVLHPDKLESSSNQNNLNHKNDEINQNDLNRDNILKYINAKERPVKPFDYIINPITEFITTLGFQTGYLAIATASDLPSTLFPDHFKSKNVLLFEEDTKSKILEIKQYDNAIKEHCNAIQHHDIAIKRKNLSIAKKQEQAKELLKTLSKDKNLSN